MFVFLKLFSRQTLDITSPESEHILPSLQHLRVTRKRYCYIVDRFDVFLIFFCRPCIMENMLENKKGLFN